MVVFSCGETFYPLVEAALPVFTEATDAYEEAYALGLLLIQMLFSHSDLKTYCRRAHQYDCVGQTGCVAKSGTRPGSAHTSDLKPVNLKCLASGLIQHEVLAYMRGGWIPPPLATNRIGHS